MTRPEPKTSLPSTETEAETDEALPTASAPVQNPELVAVAGKAASGKSLPAVETQSAQPETRRGRNWLAWLLAAALLGSVLLYVQQVQQTQRLEGVVETLSADLAEANAKVEANERHVGLIRDHVGDIVVRMSALQALVGGGAAAQVIESPEPIALPIDPERAEVEPWAPPLSDQEASELGLSPFDRSSSDLQAEFEDIETF